MNPCSSSRWPVLEDRAVRRLPQGRCAAHLGGVRSHSVPAVAAFAGGAGAAGQFPRRVGCIPRLWSVVIGRAQGCHRLHRGAFGHPVFGHPGRDQPAVATDRIGDCRIGGARRDQQYPPGRLRTPLDHRVLLRPHTRVRLRQRTDRSRPAPTAFGCSWRSSLSISASRSASSRSLLCSCPLPMPRATRSFIVVQFW